MSTIINYLDKADASTTVALNFDGGSIMDSMSEVFSSRLLWVPIALVFLYLLFKADAKNRQRVLIILAVALTVTLCDQLTSHVMKPYFARLRPSHTPGVENLLHYVNGYRGGQYGFCSSHASNSFGVATFITLMNEDRLCVLRTLALRGILAHLSRRTLLRRCIRRYSHRHCHRFPRLLYASEELPSDMALKTCCPETLRRHGASDLQRSSSPSTHLSPLGFLPYSQAPLH